MSNLLNVASDYHVTRTAHGVWRRYLDASGALYAEYTSSASFGGWPLLHITRGRSPETGRLTTARGIVAIGQKAVGALAIGQAAAGIIAFGQAATGVVAVGQAAAGLVAVGQAACGVFFGLGEVAVGAVAIGQLAVGLTGEAQCGWWWLRPLHLTVRFFPR